jgi:exodeoxyribonuclease-3
MAFRKKAEYILLHKPDILIIQECEHPDKLLYPIDLPKPKQTLWFGQNRNKGLAIFSYSDYTLSVLENHNQDLKLIIPIVASNNKHTLNLFAIWANNPTDKDGQYVEQVWKAINFYNELLESTNTILIGDFNSNTIWDRKHRVGNHSDVVQFLEKKDIFSAYHLHHKQIQGNEQQPTLFMYRHKDKPYHIDYCFVSIDLAQRLISVDIGEYDYWIKFSDHMPLIVNFEVI